MKDEVKEICIVAWISDGKKQKEVARVYRNNVEEVAEMIEELKVKLAL